MMELDGDFSEFITVVSSLIEHIVSLHQRKSASSHGLDQVTGQDVDITAILLVGLVSFLLCNTERK